MGGFAKFRSSICQRSQIGVSGTRTFCSGGKRAGFVLYGFGIRGIIERQNIRFIEPQDKRPENFRQRSVICESRIAKVFHPEEIVIERMIDAVIAVESDVERGNSGVIEERAEVGPAPRAPRGASLPGA